MEISFASFSLKDTFYHFVSAREDLCWAWQNLIGVRKLWRFGEKNPMFSKKGLSTTSRPHLVPYGCFFKWWYRVKLLVMDGDEDSGDFREASSNSVVTSYRCPFETLYLDSYMSHPQQKKARLIHYGGLFQPLQQGVCVSSHINRLETWPQKRLNVLAWPYTGPVAQWMWRSFMHSLDWPWQLCLVVRLHPGPFSTSCLSFFCPIFFPYFPSLHVQLNCLHPLLQGILVFFFGGGWGLPPPKNEQHQVCHDLNEVIKVHILRRFGSM